MVVICWARSCSANAAAMSLSFSGFSSYSTSLMMSWRYRPCGRFRIGLDVVDRLENGGSDNRSYDDAVDGGTDGKSTADGSIVPGIKDACSSAIPEGYDLPGIVSTPVSISVPFFPEYSILLCLLYKGGSRAGFSC